MLIIFCLLRNFQTAFLGDSASSSDEGDQIAQEFQERVEIVEKYDKVRELSFRITLNRF